MRCKCLAAWWRWLSDRLDAGEACRRRRSAGCDVATPDRQAVSSEAARAWPGPVAPVVRAALQASPLRPQASGIRLLVIARPSGLPVGRPPLDDARLACGAARGQRDRDHGGSSAGRGTSYAVKVRSAKTDTHRGQPSAGSLVPALEGQRVDHDPAGAGGANTISGWISGSARIGSRSERRRSDTSSIDKFRASLLPAAQTARTRLQLGPGAPS